MKRFSIAAFAAAAVLFGTLPASAQTIEFSLVNASSYTLTYFYASPSNDDSWGHDLFEEIGVLEAGYEATVYIGDDSGECVYDFRFETAEGPELEHFAINICELGVYTVSE